VEWSGSTARSGADRRGAEPSRAERSLTTADRINKLREMFNKASEGKSKLSVNDFSELSGPIVR
jgi:hypothetical protein